MTEKNLFKLAQAGDLGTEKLTFPGFCLAASIDACFMEKDVPLEVYLANKDADTAGEIGCEGEATDRLYNLLAELVFAAEKPEEFVAQPYFFTTEEEMRTDLLELRGKATVLLDTEGGKHCVGLRPYGDNPNEWQIVGIHQVIAVKPVGQPINVQCLIEPRVITTEQVWEYLCSNNPPDVKTPTALIFPAEPA